MFGKHLSEEYPDLNFGDLFDALAPHIEDRPAIICGEHKLSWGEFDKRSNRLARALMAFGLLPDSKVAFYLSNSPAYVELFAACVKARLVHANINYRYVGQELIHVLDNSDAEVVVYDADNRQQIDSIRTQLSKVRVYIEVGGDIEIGGEPSNLPALTYPFESLCTEGDDSPLDMERSGHDLYFMYTGGTTGYPKAVMWEHAARIAVIGMSDAQQPEEHADTIAKNDSAPVVLVACPLMHSTGLTSAISALVAGGCVALLSSSHFDAADCLAQIQRHEIDRVAIVGDAFSVPILEFLRTHGSDYDLSCVQLISSAGAMWSEHCKRELLEYFPNALLSDSLGSSEGSRLGASTMRRGESTKTARFEVGPMVKIFTEDFQEIEPGSGQAGLIAKTGPLPLGYYNDPEGTAKTFPVVNGVRYSMAGDWCSVEADGSMVLLGRGGNSINSGGEKIYPEEVEEALKTHPKIRDAAVLGVADERWGQAVSAVLKTVDDDVISTADIRAHLEQQIARYKHPKHILFVDKDIRHVNGKMNYRAVQAMLDNTVLDLGGNAD